MRLDGRVRQPLDLTVRRLQQLRYADDHALGVFWMTSPAATPSAVAGDAAPTRRLGPKSLRVVSAALVLVDLAALSTSGKSRKPYDHGVEREQLHAICASHAGATETYPFGERTAVYKVGGKMFALVPLDPDPPTVSLKCDPEWSEVLRNAYDAVRPGYHLNKRHWNTIVLDGTIGEDEVAELIAHSYELVAPTRRAGARGTEPAT